MQQPHYPYHHQHHRHQLNGSTQQEKICLMNANQQHHGNNISAAAHHPIQSSTMDMIAPHYHERMIANVPTFTNKMSNATHDSSSGDRMLHHASTDSSKFPSLNNATSTSSNLLPSLVSSSSSNMFKQCDNAYQQTYYSYSSFQSPSSTNFTNYSLHQHQQHASPNSPLNNISTALPNGPTHAHTWSSQDKLPNVKDLMNNSSFWQQSQQSHIEERVEETKKFNFQQECSSGAQHADYNGSSICSTATSSIEELKRKFKEHEEIISKLEMENSQLRTELDSCISSKESSRKRNRVSDFNSGKSQSSSSHSSRTDPFSNSFEELCNSSPTVEEYNEDTRIIERKSKKRKQSSTNPRPKKPQSKTKQTTNPNRSFNGKRDATVGDLERYTVEWKGESYVLVNAFKNRTQILNYYVPLYQNNFPERTCKLVLCNDEYKELSSVNPITVEKKKHAWRVSVFTMDFYNFVKNFDKKSLKIINSSSGFIPNINFEGSIVGSSPISTSTQSQPSSTNGNSVNAGTTLSFGPQPSSYMDDTSLIVSPKPISTIYNK